MPIAFGLIEQSLHLLDGEWLFPPFSSWCDAVLHRFDCRAWVIRNDVIAPGAVEDCRKNRQVIIQRGRRNAGLLAMVAERAHVRAGNRQDVRVSLRPEKLQKLALNLLIFCGRVTVLRLRLDLAKVLKPFLNGEHAQTLAAIHAGENLRNDLAGSIFRKHTFSRHFRRALVLQRDLQSLAFTRLLR